MPSAAVDCWGLVVVYAVAVDKCMFLSGQTKTFEEWRSTVEQHSRDGIGATHDQAMMLLSFLPASGRVGHKLNADVGFTQVSQ